jgi:hypothetical protein
LSQSGFRTRSLVGFITAKINKIVLTKNGFIHYQGIINLEQ